MASDRDRLLALAVRCEKASGPDRELDTEIVCAITLGVVGIDAAEPLGDQWCNRLFNYDPARCWSESWLPVPHFTASLDAALTLVPEGWVVRLIFDQGGHARCYVNRQGSIHTPRQAPTPALALCAAALRARAEPQP